MKPANPQSEWEVYLNGRWYDTVWHHHKATRDEVYDSLVNHDGYDPRIKVRCVKRDPDRRQNSVKFIQN